MTNTIGKVLRFSELTPARITRAQSIKVVVPSIDAVLDFEHQPDASWTFIMHSKKLYKDSDRECFAGVQISHNINDEAVYALYCGLTLTLCGVTDTTYDDVYVCYYYEPDEEQKDGK